MIVMHSSSVTYTVDCYSPGDTTIAINLVFLSPISATANSSLRIGFPLACKHFHGKTRLLLVRCLQSAFSSYFISLTVDITKQR